MSYVGVVVHCLRSTLASRDCNSKSMHEPLDADRHLVNLSNRSYHYFLAAIRGTASRDTLLLHRMRIHGS